MARLRHPRDQGRLVGGDLNSAGGANAKIYVYKSTDFTIQDNAAKLGATLVIGQSQSGADSPGYVDVAKTDGTANLAGNITLYQNANINVKPQGVLAFNQAVNSDTKGGLDIAAGGTSAISNEGTVKRTVVDPAGKLLFIKPKITNTAASANVVVGRNAQVNFAGGVDATQGKYSPGAGSKVKGTVKVPAGGSGTINLDDPTLTPGHYDIYIDGDLIAQSGSIRFETSVVGVYFTIHITGTLDLEAGTSVYMNVDGNTNGNSDSFQVDTLATIAQALLNINTQNRSPTPGFVYTLISGPGAVSGPGWGPLTNTGFPANYNDTDPAHLIAM